MSPILKTELIFMARERTIARKLAPPFTHEKMETLFRFIHFATLHVAPAKAAAVEILSPSRPK